MIQAREVSIVTREPTEATGLLMWELTDYGPIARETVWEQPRPSAYV